MDRYFAVRSGTPLWASLPFELRGREFRVPCKWWKGCRLSFEDWKLLVENGAAGKTVYVQKFERVDYREIISNVK